MNHSCRFWVPRINNLNKIYCLRSSLLQYRRIDEMSTILIMYNIPKNCVSSFLFKLNTFNVLPCSVFVWLINKKCKKLNGYELFFIVTDWIKNFIFIIAITITLKQKYTPDSLTCQTIFRLFKQWNVWLLLIFWVLPEAAVVVSAHQNYHQNHRQMSHQFTSFPATRVLGIFHLNQLTSYSVLKNVGVSSGSPGQLLFPGKSRFWTGETVAE